MTREEELAEMIADRVNAMGLKLYGPSSFAEAMGRQHRTLQQNFTRLCLEWIRQVGGLQEGQYDLRNEASVKVCREIVEKTGDYGLTLPYI